MTARQHRQSPRRALQSVRDARKRTGRKGIDWGKEYSSRVRSIEFGSPDAEWREWRHAQGPIVGRTGPDGAFHFGPEMLIDEALR